MTSPARISDAMYDLLVLLPTGRDAAVRASDLASQLDISERMVGALVAELIDDHYLVGSVCSGEKPGYFLCGTLEDVEVGTAHIRARAFKSLARVRQLQGLASERFGDAGERLFDIEEVAAR